MKSFFKIFILICAGEMIFSLPFHIARFFRPSFLNIFNITNTQLGDMFSSYGIFAFLSYFPGGIIADRFSFKNLISLSLLLTGLGGIYLYTIPSTTGLYYLFSYWGITTIFLFWAPLIKATKDWGADKNQGFAFGILDGGRGLVASVIASILLFFISSSVSTYEFKNIILTYTMLTFLIAGLCFFFLAKENQKHQGIESFKWEHLKEIVKNQNVWLISIIIVISYCGYKAIDNYGLYTHQVLGMTEIESSKFVTYTSYIRVFIAILIGILADKLKVSKVLALLFLILTFIFIQFPVIYSDYIFIILANLIISTLAIYGLRAIYFALIKETHIQDKYTGTVVGIVSVIGYTPDIFFASIAGRILDSAEPNIAFQRYFITLTMLSIIGFIAAFKILKNNKKMSL